MNQKTAKLIRKVVQPDHGKTAYRQAKKVWKALPRTKRRWARLELRSKLMDRS